MAKELGNTETAYLNLDEGFELHHFRKIDLIITASHDHSNLIMEVSILNGIANITVSEVSEQISPTAFLGLHKTIVASIVFAGHWK